MFSFFLAKRFFTYGETHKSGKSSASVPAVNIATFGIAIGLAVMIVSVCMVKGFQREVRNKVSGFVSHIEIAHENAFASPESYPLVTDSLLLEKVRAVPGVKHVQRFSQKLGVFKTEDSFAGVALKGVARDYDLTFLKQHLVEGEMPQFKDNESGNRIVISRLLANRLNLKTGDRIFCYFFSETLKQRRFTISGIFDTKMPQFDKAFVMTDLFTVNKLNGWQTDQSSGLEIRLDSYDAIPMVQKSLVGQFVGKQNGNGSPYSVMSVNENPRTKSLLSWLDLLDFNIMIILIIMICVAGFTMISGLLILILDRTGTIGLLKALGATNRRIRHTFLWFAAFIVGRGLLWGNVLGLALVALQYYFQVARLDPDIYYVDAVPVDLNLLWIIGINMFSLFVTMLALVLPSFLISRIQPAKAIQFD